ncbi:MAG: hypothetical protein ABSA39_22730 [Edaphobacter sp.]
MLPTTREDTKREETIEALALQLSDLMSAQIADLREYARATSVGEGTMHLERNLRRLELHRVELYRQLEEIAFIAP